MQTLTPLKPRPLQAWPARPLLRHRAVVHAWQALVVAGLLATTACSNNDAPPMATAADDTFTVGWDAASPLAVLGNDTASGGTAVLSVAAAPKNGTLSLNAGVLSYTPNAGYFGPDEFSYRLDVDSATSTATVRLVVEAQFALQGVVTDGPIANAKVQAAVGSQTFSADADAAGRYSVAVKASQPSDFVTLTATGVGSQSAVVLTSHVGEVGGLATQVVGGKLTAERAPALMVTHLSAAQAGLMAQAGSAPRSNAELAAAAQKIDSNAVLYAAALVRLVVDGGVALPEGVASTRELLQSAASLVAFQTARRVADKPQLEAAWTAALTDPALNSPPPVPATGAAPVVLRFGYGAGGTAIVAPRLTLRADGSATVVTDSARPAQWRMDGAALVLTYDNPIIRTGFTNAVSPPFVQYPTEFGTTALRFSDVGASNGRYALASMTTLAYTVIQGGPDAGRRDSVSSSLLRRYEVAALALRTADFPVGTRIAGLASERSPVAEFNANRQDVLRITGAGIGTMERTGATAYWRVFEGALLVDVGTLAIRYVPLGTGPLGEERWAMEQLDTALDVTSHREVMAVRANEVSMSAADWVKPWVGNLNASAGFQLVAELQANGRWGNNGAERGDPLPVVTNFVRHWRQLPDGRLEMASSTPGNCNPFVGLPNCTITLQRFWTPLARVGRTVWVMEHLIFNPGNPASTTNDYRFVAFTDTSAGS